MNNDRTATTPAGGPRPGLRARLGGLNITRRRGALGVPEIAALGVAALLLMTAVLSYLFLLAPQRSRKDALEAERGDLQRKLLDQQSILGQGQDTQQRVSEILTSLNDFQVGKLGQAASGSKTVIEEMNRLIVKNKLRISGGVSFTQLQETAPGADQNQSRRREEGGQRIVQSVFPGIGVTLTVEGTYANLRHFIRDIEADRQFVVIDAVELEGVTDSNASAPSPVAAGQVPLPAQGQPGAAAALPAPSTPSRGALVSLRLDMAAYFRRANSEATQ
ncbi:MAG TPA: GspMb/PilO family protein [Pyrinomonadaceae bacterium]|nr:GspMb/PilO family protein [Pyrinomonadaceae bacterium]